jgi:hypothetical protein
VRAQVPRNGVDGLVFLFDADGEGWLAHRCDYLPDLGLDGLRSCAILSVK